MMNEGRREKKERLRGRGQQTVHVTVLTVHVRTAGDLRSSATERPLAAKHRSTKEAQPHNIS